MTTAQTKGLYAALLEVQKNAPGLVKDATNPHFNNRFVSLDGLLSQVRPLLTEQGIVLTQRPTVVANGDGLVPALKTTLVHAASGEELSDTMLLLLGKDDPQGQGSALTYARRYALMSMLALAGEEDDDGLGASRQQTRTQGNGRSEQSQFQVPTGKPASAAVLKKLKARIDAHVDAKRVKQEAMDNWAQNNYGVPLDKLPENAVKELNERLDTFERNLEVPV